MYLPGKQRSIPIVLEIGSFTTRAGYAGEDSPALVCPSDVGYNTEEKEYKNFDFKTILMPNMDQILNPYQNDMITDYDLIEYKIEDILQNKLRVQPKDHPIFLVEPPLNRQDFRLKMVEMIFEKFQMKGVFLHKSPILSSYIFAKENLIVLDSGANFTYCSPILEGTINQKALIKSNIAGEYLTKEMLKILLERGDINPYKKVNNKQQLPQAVTEFGQQEVAREIKHQMCKILDFKIDQLKFNQFVDNTVFELPDKKTIEISKEIYAIPELMFEEIENLQFKGIQNLIQQSIEKIDIQQRKELLQNIVIIGGNSILPNFIERLQKELYECNLGGLQNKAKVYTANGYNDQQHSSWLGGSIMASMPSFDQYLMFKEDYDEHGAMLIDRKCFC